MDIIHSNQELQTRLSNQKLKVSFVPTMGNLHIGHMSLIKKAQSVSDLTIVSIYVNPMQFGANEDYSSYPRTLDQDATLLKEYNVDILYLCQTQEIYPEGSSNHTKISVDLLDGIHCGKTRPNFFSGITTIVMKLFNIVRPDIAIFGEKDFQQLCIIQKMVKDMHIPVQIISAPIARNKDGLAYSSRNGYLTKDEREKIAPLLYRCLTNTQKTIQQGNYHFDHISRNAIAQLASDGFKPDYFNISNTKTLMPATIHDKELVVLVAAYLGKARLIDNIIISCA